MNALFNNTKQAARNAAEFASETAKSALNQVDRYIQLDKDKVQMSISLEKPAYLPGEVLRGSVHVDVLRDVKLTAIRVQLTGMEMVSLDKTLYVNGDVFLLKKSDACQIALRNGNAEVFVHFDKLITVYGYSKASGRSGGAELSPGSYDYPFQVQLPTNMPPSYMVDNKSGRSNADGKKVESKRELSSASLQYCATATLVMSSGPNGLMMLPFKVLSVVSRRELLQGKREGTQQCCTLTAKGSKSSGASCCKSDTVVGKGEQPHVNLTVSSSQTVGVVPYGTAHQSSSQDGVLPTNTRFNSVPANTTNTDHNNNNNNPDAPVYGVPVYNYANSTNPHYNTFTQYQQQAPASDGFRGYNPDPSPAGWDPVKKPNQNTNNTNNGSYPNPLNAPPPAQEITTPPPQANSGGNERITFPTTFELQVNLSNHTGESLSKVAFDISVFNLVRLKLRKKSVTFYTEFLHQTIQLDQLRGGRTMIPHDADVDATLSLPLPASLRLAPTSGLAVTDPLPSFATARIESSVAFCLHLRGSPSVVDRLTPDMTFADSLYLVSAYDECNFVPNVPVFYEHAQILGEDAV
ncbi:Arrestin (or S-antigen), N-terminal domain containing protein, putative [Angomonas deanei]|uniref:Arrestin (Or S-antigen), N-terminal domain containing protein, putative n=1 Tax=Angomonas deanei TaxID=59799 RepID=A0A7G2CI89_9TRYP|nr:Arrestin (or S-antigen), N-terminal domain containing protein, putative [Angomonas deanei]